MYINVYVFNTAEGEKINKMYKSATVDINIINTDVSDNFF